MKNYTDRITYDVRYIRFRDDRKVQAFADMGVLDDEEIVMHGSLWFVARCDGKGTEWIIIHNERGLSDEDAFLAASAADMGRRHRSISFGTLGAMKAYIARRDKLQRELAEQA